MKLNNLCPSCPLSPLRPLCLLRPLCPLRSLRSFPVSNSVIGCFLTTPLKQKLILIQFF